MWELRFQRYSTNTKRYPRKKFLETLSLVLPAKTTVSLIVQSRDGNSAAYAAARCCWSTAPRSVATKICITSQRQRRTAFYNFFIFFTINPGELLLYVLECRGGVLGLGLGLEASSPRKLAYPRLEDSAIF